MYDTVEPLITTLLYKGHTLSDAPTYIYTGDTFLSLLSRPSAQLTDESAHFSLKLFIMCRRNDKDFSYAQSSYFCGTSTDHFVHYREVVLFQGVVGSSPT